MQEAGYKVTMASPDGGQIVLDDISLEESAVTPDVKKFLEDGMAAAQLPPCLLGGALSG